MKRICPLPGFICSFLILAFLQADANLPYDISEKLLGRLVKAKYDTDFFILDKFPLAVRKNIQCLQTKTYTQTNFNSCDIISGATLLYNARPLRCKVTENNSDKEPECEVTSFRLIGTATAMTCSCAGKRSFLELKGFTILRCDISQLSLTVRGTDFPHYCISFQFLIERAKLHGVALDTIASYIDSFRLIAR